MTNQAQIQANVSQLRDDLRALGIAVPFALKRRDPLEPGRTQKEAAEDKIFALFMKQFRKQRKQIKELLERFSFGRKKTTSDEVDFLIGMLNDEFFNDEQVIAEAKNFLTNAAEHGIELFGDANTLQIDYTLTNTRAADWVSKYAFDLIKGINKTTTKSLRNIFKNFIDTPGMTIGDVMDILPFDESRALMIATTEITRAYATAAQMAGEDLAEEFPGVRVIKRWWTNNDSLVCPICGPLHGAVVDVDASFDSLAGSLSQPPAHVGCRCWISTTTRIVEPELPLPIAGGGNFADDIKYRESKNSWEFDEAVKKMDTVINTGQGELNIRMSFSTDIVGEGVYTPEKNKIRIRPSDFGVENTTLHEIGHAIDDQLLAENLGIEGGRWGSLQFSSPEFEIEGIKEIDDYWKAVENSKTYKTLQRERDELEDEQYDYLLDPRETFARSYSQYIAEKTQDPALLLELNNTLETGLYDTQWGHGDFEPILKALDALFEKAGMSQ